MISSSTDPYYYKTYNYSNSHPYRSIQRHDKPQHIHGKRYHKQRRCKCLMQFSVEYHGHRKSRDQNEQYRKHAIDYIIELGYKSNHESSDRDPRS